jgi:hypothetical protein
MDAYSLGMHAAWEGKPYSANPYDDGIADHTLWGAGWRHGHKQSLAA